MGTLPCNYQSALPRPEKEQKGGIMVCNQSRWFCQLFILSEDGTFAVSPEPSALNCTEAMIAGLSAGWWRRTTSDVTPDESLYIQIDDEGYQHVQRQQGGWIGAL